MALRIVIFHNYVGLPEGNMIRLLNIGLYCEYIEGLDALWYGCNFFRRYMQKWLSQPLL